jgi:hypothetical protein
MVVQKQRTQILLEPEQHSSLVEIAHQEERSISDVVRSIVDQYLSERSKDAQRQRAGHALAKLINMRNKIEARSGVYQGDLLAEARAEREAHMESVWSGTEP